MVVMVVVRPVDIGPLSPAQHCVVQRHIVLRAADFHGAGVKQLQAEAARAGQNILLALHGPAGVVIAHQIPARPGLIDERLDVAPVVAAGAQLPRFFAPGRLLRGHVLAELGVKPDEGGVMGVLGQQVQVDLRAVVIQAAVGGGAYIRLIPRHQQKIGLGGRRVVIGRLVVGDGQDGIALLPIRPHQLLRGEPAVGQVGVAVQVGLVLPGSG